MSVVNFPRKRQLPAEGWQPDELQELLATCAGSIAAGSASGWEIGATERGDPQIYLLGPAPDHECILCISRVGGRYIIEDGRGHVLLEQDSLVLLTEQALAALKRRKEVFFAQIAVAWYALREAVEEKTEALTAEPMELLTHVAPQLAMLA